MRFARRYFGGLSFDRNPSIVRLADDHRSRASVDADVVTLVMVDSNRRLGHTKDHTGIAGITDFKRGIETHIRQLDRRDNRLCSFDEVQSPVAQKAAAVY